MGKRSFLYGCHYFKLCHFSAHFLSGREREGERETPCCHSLSILMALLFMVFNALYWPWLLRYEEVELTGKVDKGKAYLDTDS